MLQAKDSLDLRLLNPMTLAFVGDGVYEMLAREEIVRRHISLSADRLHRRTVELVRASAQAAGFLAIEPLLTETELAVFKRGPQRQRYHASQEQQRRRIQGGHRTGGAVRLALSLGRKRAAAGALPENSG